MARPGASVKVDARKAIGEFSAMRQRMADPVPALKRVGRYVTELSKQAFEDGADPETHVPWPELSWATMQKRRGSTAQILVNSGRLRKDIHPIITGRRSVAIGTNVSYGKYHQFGTRDIPERPFLGIDGPGEREIQNIVMRYIERGTR
jgi:phage gpG-like protein